MRLRLLGITLLVAVGLTGCLGANYGTGSTRSNIDPVAYQADEKGYAGYWNNFRLARRNINTEIVGNPFNMDKEVFDLVAAQIMTAQQSGPRFFFQPKVYFANLPGQAPRPQYRFVIVFNPAVSVSGPELCAGAQVPTYPAFDKRIVVRTAFCRLNEYLSGATSERFNIDDIRDQGFTNAISHALQATFPQQLNLGGQQDTHQDRMYDRYQYHLTLGCEQLGTCSPEPSFRGWDY